MPSPRNDYGLVYRIVPEAFGEPGQRTFRVSAANEVESASLWMEKQQLAELGRAIDIWLRRLSAQRGLRPRPDPDPRLAYNGAARLDFRVAQLALGFEEDAGTFLLLAYSPEDTDEDHPMFGCQATASQFRALLAEIERVVAAGRPLCPLCGLPIDPSGHACIRANGHSKQAIPPLQTDEE